MVIRSLVQKIVQEKRRHIQRLRVDKNKSKVTKIVTVIHHFEKVIHQHLPLLVIIQ